MQNNQLLPKPPVELKDNIIVTSISTKLQQKLTSHWFVVFELHAGEQLCDRLAHSMA